MRLEPQSDTGQRDQVCPRLTCVRCVTNVLACDCAEDLADDLFDHPGPRLPDRDGLPGHRFRTDYICAALIVVTTACSSLGVDQTAQGSVYLEPETTPQSEEPIEPSAELPSLTPMSITYIAGDGTKLRVTFELSSLMPATDPRIAAFFSTYSGAAPCAPDQGRDTVSVGTARFDNLTPDFSTSMQLEMTSYDFNKNDSEMLGVAYGDGAQCPAGGDAASFGYLNPEITGATWGPVPIELVVPDAYSPSRPGGDSIAKRAGDPVVYPRYAGWSIADFSGPIDGLEMGQDAPPSFLHGGVLKIDELG